MLTWLRDLNERREERKKKNCTQSSDTWLTPGRHVNTASAQAVAEPRCPPLCSPSRSLSLCALAVPGTAFNNHRVPTAVATPTTALI